jgi:hypothetical protein
VSAGDGQGDGRIFHASFTEEGFGEEEDKGNETVGERREEHVTLTAR